MTKMDEVNAIVQVISTVGFPICMCLVMGYYIKYLNDQHKSEIEELNSAHKTETQELTKTIENNTIVMEKLSTKIDTIFDLKCEDGGTNE